MSIIHEKNQLFDNDFNCISTNIDDIIQFCNKLSSITHIQCCNSKGMLYEYLPEVYQSVVNCHEMQNM